jgi:predicted phosphodiesterase
MKAQYYEFSKPISVYVLTDLHVGNKNFAQKQFEAICNMIEHDESAYYILLGDLADAITPKDRRYSHKIIDPKYPTVDSQYDYLANALPDGALCLGVLTGNHDEALRKHIGTGADFAEDLAKEINAPYLGYMNYIQIKIEKWKQTLFCWHGHGKGKQAGGRLNNLVRMSAHHHADIYLCGHYHMFNYHIGGQWVIKRNKLVQETKQFVHCGGFYKGWTEKAPTGYEAHWGLMPSHVCATVLTMVPKWTHITTEDGKSVP